MNFLANLLRGFAPQAGAPADPTGMMPGPTGAPQPQQPQQPQQGQPGGFGQAIQTASPLLLSLAAGMRSGDPTAHLGEGIAAMKDQQGKKEYDTLLQNVFGGGASPMAGVMGGGQGPVAGAPTGFTGLGGSTSPMADTMKLPIGDATREQPFQIQPSGGQLAPQLGELFALTEQNYGLPEGFLARTAQIESNMDPNARNPNSSAGGLFQFIDSTAQQYGVDRFDPTQATEGAGRLAADNARHLRRTLGREPTAGELYLAHQQGAGGASKLLSNPDALAADLVGVDAVRLNGGDPNSMTAGEFANKWTGKFAQGGGASVPSGSAGASAGGIAPGRFDNVPTERLFKLLQSPYADPAVKQVVGGLLQQRLAGPEQMTPYQQATLDLERQRFEAEQNAGPKLPSAVQEYQFAQQQGYQGSFADWEQQNRKAGATNVNVGGVQETEFQKKAAGTFAEDWQGYREGAQSAQDTLNQLDRMQINLDHPDFYSGALSEELVLPLRRLGAVLGIDTSGVASMEDFRAASNQAILDRMGGSLGTAISDGDRQFVINQMPNLSNTPEGNRQMIEIQRRLARREVEIGQLANEYVQENGQLDAGFDQILNRYAQQNPLFADLMQAAPGPITATPFGGGLSSRAAGYLAAPAPAPAPAPAAPAPMAPALPPRADAPAYATPSRRNGRN